MAITNEPRTAYSKLLQDPRWQKKRLKIMERDNFTCCVCGTTDDTLHVHHRYYKSSEGPWDYPDRALVTLCHQCHELHGHGALSGQDHLVTEVLGAGAFFDEMNVLAEAFSKGSNLSAEDFKIIANFIALYCTDDQFQDLFRHMYEGGHRLGGF